MTYMRGVPLLGAFLTACLAAATAQAQTATATLAPTAGNTTAGTIPLAMATARQEGKLKKGDLVLMASVGAGFTVGATLLRWAY